MYIAAKNNKKTLNAWFIKNYYDKLEIVKKKRVIIIILLIGHPMNI